MISSLCSITNVCIGRRSTGGSSNTLMSRMPVKLICSVRGIGVALSVRTSTFPFICLIFSLCVTPNRCSSSTINNPKFLNSTSLDSRRCVPTIISTCPFRSRSIDFFCCAGVRKRDNISTLTGKSPSRSHNVL